MEKGRGGLRDLGSIYKVAKGGGKHLEQNVTIAGAVHVSASKTFLSIFKLPDAESPEEAIDLSQFPETPIEGDEDLFFSPPSPIFVKKVGEVKPAVEVVSRDAVADETSTSEVHTLLKEASPASEMQQRPTVEDTVHGRSDGSRREVHTPQAEASPASEMQQRPTVEDAVHERSDGSRREAAQDQDEANQNPSAPTRPVQLQTPPPPKAADCVQGAPPNRTPPAPPPLVPVPSDLPKIDTESQPTSPSRPTSAGVRRIIVVSPKATATTGRPLPPAPYAEIAALNEAEEESAC